MRARKSLERTKNEKQNRGRKGKRARRRARSTLFLSLTPPPPQPPFSSNCTFLRRARLRPCHGKLTDQQLRLDAAGEKSVGRFSFFAPRLDFSFLNLDRPTSSLSLSLSLSLTHPRFLLSRSFRPCQQAASSSVADIVNTALSTAASATAGAGGAIRRGAATADALYAAYRTEYCAPAQYIPSTKMPANFTSEFHRERERERRGEKEGKTFELIRTNNLSPFFFSLLQYRKIPLS